MSAADALKPFVDMLADAVAQRLQAAGQGQAGAIRPRLLDPQSAGKYLGRSARAVLRLIHEGKLPSVRIDNKNFLDIRDLDRIIEESKDTAL